MADPENALRAWLSDQRGQDLVEYTLLLAFIVTGATAIFLSMPDSMSVIWRKAENELVRARTAAGL